MKHIISMKWSNSEKYLVLLTVFLLMGQMLLSGSLPVKFGFIAQPATFLSYVNLGYTRFITAGFYHGAFTLAFFLLSPKTEDIVRQAISFAACFLVAELLTLQGMVSTNAYILQSLVLLSVFFVSLENIFARKLKIDNTRHLLVAACGLVHGAAIGNMFLNSGAADPTALFSYASFSTGLLLGEVSILAALFVVVGKFLATKEFYKRLVVTPVSLLLAGYCLYEVFKLVVVPN
ncbi:MAG: HupE/UreJ family protein [Bacteroidota bacterium]